MQTIIGYIVGALLNWLLALATSAIKKHEAKVEQEQTDAAAQTAAQGKLDAAKNKADQIAAAKDILKGI